MLHEEAKRAIQDDDDEIHSRSFFLFAPDRQTDRQTKRRTDIVSQLKSLVEHKPKESSSQRQMLWVSFCKWHPDTLDCMPSVFYSLLYTQLSYVIGSFPSYSRGINKFFRVSSNHHIGTYVWPARLMVPLSTSRKRTKMQKTNFCLCLCKSPCSKRDTRTKYPVQRNSKKGERYLYIVDKRPNCPSESGK